MNYKSIRHDVSASCVGALVALPQAVAYGLIAIAPLGLDWAVFGIMSSVGSTIVFGLITGLWGPNRFMLSGPGAVTSLMVASAIAVALARGFDAETALALAYAGVIVAGLFQAVAGQMRLGQVTSFIPVPVLSGFVNASALLVLISALPTMLGLPGVVLWKVILSQAHTISLWAVAVGGLTLVGQLVLDGRTKGIPVALVTLVMGSALYHIGASGFGLPAGPLVGNIDILALWREPPLITPSIHWANDIARDFTAALSWRDADIPLLTGLSMGLLASFNIVIGSNALAVRTDQNIDSNAELRVHGFANILMGVLGFLPGDASLGRSTAVLTAGARTRMANYGSAVAFAALLIIMAPLVAMLPLWATAGMLVATSVKAIDRTTLNQIKGVILQSLPYPRVVIGDIAVTVAVVVTALMINLIAAVGVGVFLSVALFVFGMSRSPVRRVYRGSRFHSKIHRPPDEIQYLEQEGQRIAVIEIQGALFFGSCARLLDEAKKLLADGVQYLILDFKHLTSLDSTGATKLRGLALMCQQSGAQLMISYVQPERRTTRAQRHFLKTLPAISVSKSRRAYSNPRWVWLSLHANAITKVIGDDWFYNDTDSALVNCESLLLKRRESATASKPKRRISHSDQFTGLSRTQIAQLGAVATRQNFQMGQPVFCQGDRANDAYFLVHGQMDVEIDIPNTNRKKRISTLTRGTIFGEMGIIDGAPRSATVTATRNSLCYALDSESYAKLQSQHPELVVTLLSNISRQFSSRLRIANIIISELD